MIKVRRKYDGKIVYFKFLSSAKYPDCFWYTKTTENEGFELGRINDYEPIENTWKELK